MSQTMSHSAAEAASVTGALVRAVIGGFAGTVVFTLMMTFLAPMMLGHPMDIVGMLGAFTGLGRPAGLVMHFLLGSVGFAVAFLIVAPYLPGPLWLRGMILLAGVWLFVGLVVMPMMGVGLFFGGPKEAMAALMGHVILGGVLGSIARLPPRPMRSAVS